MTKPNAQARLRRPQRLGDVRRCAISCHRIAGPADSPRGLFTLLSTLGVVLPPLVDQEPVSLSPPTPLTGVLRDGSVATSPNT